MNCKTHSVASSVGRAHHILRSRTSTCAQRFSLIHKIAQSTALWASPVWVTNQRSLQKLRAAVNNQYKKHLRLPRFLGELDEHFSKRQNKAIRAMKSQLALTDLDVLATRRLHSYSGHIARRSATEPGLLLSIVLLWNRQEVALLSVQRPSEKQGHRGKFAPWHWEGQLTRHSHGQREQDWIKVAQRNASGETTC